MTDAAGPDAVTLEVYVEARRPIAGVGVDHHGGVVMTPAQGEIIDPQHPRGSAKSITQFMRRARSR
jgi:hypothetical protein